MNRRQALKSLGAAAALPLSSQELYAIGLSAHTRVQSGHAEERYLFQCLDPEESENLAAATELIIPETDTPGARSAKVPEFIDAVLAGWFEDEERLRFLRGLRDMDERARKSEGAAFSACTNEAQVRILREMEAEALRTVEAANASRLARRAAQSGPGAPFFFSVLKWLTLFGYFTSEAGMVQELEYVEFPGSYDGCAPLRTR
jgi:hypothetical protein